MGLSLIDQLVAPPPASLSANKALSVPGGEEGALPSGSIESQKNGAFEELLIDIKSVTAITTVSANAVSHLSTAALDKAAPSDLVLNVVLSQADAQEALQAKIASLTAEPSQVLSALTGNKRSDVKLLTSIEVTPAQSGALASLIENYLARPDVAAALPEAQRTALLSVASQLRQFAEGEKPQPLTPVLAPLTRGAFEKISAPQDNELLDKIARFLQQLLREAAQKTSQAAQTASAVPHSPDSAASVKEGTLLPFSGSVGSPRKNPQTEENSEEKEKLGDPSLAQITPVIAAPAPLVGVPAGTTHLSLDIVLDGQKRIAAVAPEPRQQSTDDIADVDKTASLLPQQELENLSLAAFYDSERNAYHDKTASADSSALDISALDALTEEDNFADLIAQFEKIAAVIKKSDTGFVKIADSFSTADEGQSISLGAETAGTETTGTPIIGLSSTFASSQIHVVQNGAAHVARAVPVEQIHVAIKQAHKEGLDSITIQLAPDDLGRVEVRFDRSAEGIAHIVFTVDTQEAFDQLQRDARALERTLAESGVKADAGSMEFNLRQQHHGQDGNQQSSGFNGNTPSSWRGLDAESEGPEIRSNATSETEISTQIYNLTLDTGVNIRV